jgi:ATP-dependent Lon protease
LLILSGYLRNRFVQDIPLTLSASLCFEQSYSGIDGDSASSTELYALLSRLAEVPLRQDLAVTGSVNQWGEVQAIGGANEKIEGFFDVCKAHGLTGQQGVLIPASNVRHVILRADVMQTIEQGQFHIYPIRTIDQGIELLSGVRAGSIDEPDTINGRVSQRLQELAVQIKKFGSDMKKDADAAGEKE